LGLDLFIAALSPLYRKAAFLSLVI